MRLKSFCVKNYRRLRDVRIELDAATTIFVGPNNSGKTSAAQVLDSFLGSSRKGRFSIHDFSAECWLQLDAIGAAGEAPTKPLPTISLDLWFQIEEAELHRVVHLLPSLDWEGTPLGVRLEYAPKNERELLSRFRDALARAQGPIDEPKEDLGDFPPWPSSLSAYLEKRIGEEYVSVR